MLVKEIIDKVSQQLNRTLEPKGTKWDDRVIYSAILDTRATLVSQRRFVSSFMYQTIPCIPLEKIDKSAAPECYTTEEYIWRSTIELPLILSKGKMLYVDHVLSIAGDRISLSEHGSSKYNEFSRFKKDRPTAYIVDKKLYLTKEQCAVSLSAVFYDPVQINNLNIPDSECCSSSYSTFDPLNDDFPIDGELLKPLVEMSTQELLHSAGFIREDIQQEGVDSTEVGRQRPQARTPKSK